MLQPTIRVASFQYQLSNFFQIADGLIVDRQNDFSNVETHMRHRIGSRVVDDDSFVDLLHVQTKFQVLELVDDDAFRTAAIGDGDAWKEDSSWTG